MREAASVPCESTHSLVSNITMLYMVRVFVLVYQSVSSILLLELLRVQLVLTALCAVREV